MEDDDNDDDLGSLVDFHGNSGQLIRLNQRPTMSIASRERARDRPCALGANASDVMLMHMAHAYALPSAIQDTASRKFVLGICCLKQLARESLDLFYTFLASTNDQQ